MEYIAKYGGPSKIAWGVYEAHKALVNQLKRPSTSSRFYSKLGDVYSDAYSFGSRKKQRIKSFPIKNSKSKKLYSDSVDMPSFGRKQKKGGKGVYQGNRVPGRNGYVKRGTAPGIKTFKKKLRTKSAKKGGSSRLFDMVAPPISVYNREFVPRSMDIDGDVVQVIEKLKDSAEYKTWIQSPTATSENPTATDIANEAAVPTVMSNIMGESNYYPCWTMYPILTTAEAITYLMKAINNPRAIAWDAHHHPIISSSHTGQAHHTIKDSTGAAIDTAMVPTDIDISNLYGTMEGFKMTYTVANMNECSVWLTVYECRPRDPHEHAVIPMSGTATGDKIQNVNLNPLSLIQYDVHKKQLIRQTKYANGALVEDEKFPKGLNHGTVNDDWKFTKDLTKCREFNKNYVCLQTKAVCLKPGERFQYDVVIPGFGMRFDKYLKKSQSSNAVDFVLAEMQSTFTRFLLFKHRSVRMFKLGEQTNTDGVIEPAWPIDGRQAYLEDCKLTIRASKYLRCRLVPKREKCSLRTGGNLDIDAFGTMPNYVAPAGLESKNVASWNGRNIYQVNRYPNLGPTIISSGSSASSTNINPSTDTPEPMDTETTTGN